MRLNSKNYKENLKGISVIEVSGESCANCLTLMPILHKLVSSMDKVELHHVEAAEDTMDILEEFNVEAVPTILVMYNDEVRARCKGYQPEEILELWLESKIEDIKNNK